MKLNQDHHVKMEVEETELVSNAAKKVINLSNALMKPNQDWNVQIEVLLNALNVKKKAINLMTVHLQVEEVELKTTIQAQMLQQLGRMLKKIMLKDGVQQLVQLTGILLRLKMHLPQVVLGVVHLKLQKKRMKIQVVALGMHLHLQTINQQQIHGLNFQPNRKQNLVELGVNNLHHKISQLQMHGVLMLLLQVRLMETHGLKQNMVPVHSNQSKKHSYQSKKRQLQLICGLLLLSNSQLKIVAGEEHQQLPSIKSKKHHLTLGLLFLSQSLRKMVVGEEEPQKVLPSQ